MTMSCETGRDGMSEAHRRDRGGASETHNVEDSPSVRCVFLQGTSRGYGQ